MLFAVVASYLSFGQTITQYEYWFNELDGQRTLVPSTGTPGAFDIQAPVSLGTGVHTIHIRWKDSNGRWGPVASRRYRNFPGGANLITSLRYWSDQVAMNPGNMRVVSFDPPVTVLSVIDSLEFCFYSSTGNQAVFFQLLDTRGYWSPVISRTINVQQTGAPAQPAAIQSSQTSYCPGDVVTLTTGYAGAGVIATSYNWVVPTGNGWSSAASTTNSIEVTIGSVPGIIEVFGVTDFCGQSTLPATLSIMPIMPPSQPGPITGDTTVCAGTMGAQYSVPNDPTLDYSWTVTGGWTDSGAGNPFSTDVGTADATISVVTTNQCGDDSPVALAAITVEEAPDAGLDGTLAICSDGTAADLFAQLGGSPEPGGTWTDPNNQAHPGSYDPGVDDGGVYTYTVGGTTSCPDATAEVVVTETPAPDAGLDAAITVCDNGDPVPLLLELGGAPDTNGTWTAPGGGTHTGDFDPGVNAAGTYTYTVIGTAPCGSASAVVDVQVDVAPVVVTTFSLDTIVEAQSPLQFIVSGADTYSWTFDATYFGWDNDPDQMDGSALLLAGTFVLPGTEVCVTGNDTVTGCNSDELCFTVDIVTGSNEGLRGAQRFTLYPNPVHGTLQMVVQGGLRSGEYVTFLDGLGRMVQLPTNWAGTILTADVSGLSSGVYHVQLAGADRALQAHFVVQH